MDYGLTTNKTFRGQYIDFEAKVNVYARMVVIIAIIVILMLVPEHINWSSLKYNCNKRNTNTACSKLQAPNNHAS